MKRERYETCAAVLDTLAKITYPKGYMGITRIMYKIGTNCSKAKKILKILETGDLITVDGKKYSITTDGRIWLKNFRKMVALMNLDYNTLIKIR